MYWIIDTRTGRALEGPFYTYLEAELVVAKTVELARTRGDLPRGMPDGVAIAGDASTLN